MLKRWLKWYHGWWLLNTGGRSPQDDLQMIQDLELTRNSAQV